MVKNLGIDHKFNTSDQENPSGFLFCILFLIKLLDPPKSKRLIAKTNAATLPPEISISLAAASAVPPVAIKSSIIRTESPLFN